MEAEPLLLERRIAVLLWAPYLELDMARAFAIVTLLLTLTSCSVPNGPLRQRCIVDDECASEHYCAHCDDGPVGVCVEGCVFGRCFNMEVRSECIEESPCLQCPCKRTCVSMPPRMRQPRSSSSATSHQGGTYPSCESGSSISNGESGACSSGASAAGTSGP